MVVFWAKITLELLVKETIFLFVFQYYLSFFEFYYKFFSFLSYTLPFLTFHLTQNSVKFSLRKISGYILYMYVEDQHNLSCTNGFIIENTRIAHMFRLTYIVLVQRRQDSRKKLDFYIFL